MPANAGDTRDARSIPGLGRSPGEGNGNPLQYPCLENPMDRGAWRALVLGVAGSWTWLSTHSTVATWNEAEAGLQPIATGKGDPQPNNPQWADCGQQPPTSSAEPLDDSSPADALQPCERPLGFGNPANLCLDAWPRDRERIHVLFSLPCLLRYTW